MRMPEPPAAVEILRGRNDWLFMRGDTNRVLDQHTGVLLPEDGWEDRWVTLLCARGARLDADGIAWIGHIAPDKEAVYADMLPAGIEPAPVRAIDRFQAAVTAAGLPVTYGLAAQREAQPGGITFHKSDTHWNARGGWVAATAICRELADRGIEAPPLPHDAVAWRDAMITGDLGGKLDPPERGATITGQVRKHRAKLTGDNRIVNNGRLIRFEHEEPGSLPSAVLFGQSFANNVLPFLKESFSRLTFCHSRWIDPGLVRREHPDAVIFLPIERFLFEIPADRGVARKLAALRVRKRLRGVVAGPPGEAGSYFLDGIPT